MPYIYVNDRVEPWAYYSGQGFLVGVDTVVEERAAQRYETLQTAVAGPLRHRQDLRAMGWRIVPVER